jgi:hypothetical protein
MKKTLNSRFTLILALLLTGMPLLLPAQTYSEKKEQSHSFKLKSGTLVQISNKYGNVTIMPWEKDSVRFEVSISAQSKQAAKVIKILSSIDCEMISAPNTISARTVFYDNGATFWKDMVSYAGQVLSTNNNLQIHYTVYMPVTNPVKIENKFGNVYMDNQKGNADITVSNGDLQARNFGGILKLKIEFGNASIQDAEDARLTVNYADLTLGKAGSLNLDSRSSTLGIEETETAEISSQRDKMTFRSCGSLSGDASFSRIRVNELTTLCTLNTKYGELRLNSIPRTFRSIQLRSEYTDIYLGLGPSVACSADLLYDAKTSLNISSSLAAQLKKETLDAKLGTMQSTGTLGKSAASHISVNAKAGSLSLMNK